MTVVDFPKVRKIHREVVKPAEMYAQRQCPDEMVWDMCIYLRQELNCHECPEWEDDEHYGRVQRGCRGLAHEACRIALAWQKRMEVKP